MELIVTSAILMAIVIAIMSIGVIFSNKQLKGSCGGIGSQDCHCKATGQQLCPDPPASGGRKKLTITKSAHDPLH